MILNRPRGFKLLITAPSGIRCLLSQPEVQGDLVQASLRCSNLLKTVSGFSRSCIGFRIALPLFKNCLKSRSKEINTTNRLLCFILGGAVALINE